MELLTFISELSKIFAWPVTALIVVVIIRKPILEVIDLLRRMKYNEFELDFSKEISDLIAMSAHIAHARKKNDHSNSFYPSNLINHGTFSSRAAIIEAWLDVEAVAVSVVHSHWWMLSNESYDNLSKLGEYLLQCNIIDEKEFQLFNQLRQLSYKASLAEEINLSEKDAMSYVNVASNLASHIRMGKSSKQQSDAAN